MSKRQFPYYTPVNTFDVKRQTSSAQDPQWNERGAPQPRGQSSFLDDSEDFRPGLYDQVANNDP
jgi:hypothetical protein